MRRKSWAYFSFAHFSTKLTCNGKFSQIIRMGMHIQSRVLYVSLLSRSKGGPYVLVRRVRKNTFSTNQNRFLMVVVIIKKIFRHVNIILYEYNNILFVRLDFPNLRQSRETSFGCPSAAPNVELLLLLLWSFCYFATDNNFGGFAVRLGVWTVGRVGRARSTIVALEQPQETIDRYYVQSLVLDPRWSVLMRNTK